MPKQSPLTKEDEVPKTQPHHSSFWDYVPIVASHRTLQRKLEQALAEADAEYERTQMTTKEVRKGIATRQREVEAVSVIKM